MATQRIRVRGRDAALVLGIAVVCSIVVALDPPSPTGRAGTDVVLTFAATMFVVWAAASAPWWAGVVAAGIATALAPSLGWLLLGAVPVVAGLAVGAAQRSLPWSRALIAGITTVQFAHLGHARFFGLTSIIAIATLTALSVLGVRRRPRRERRRIWIGMGATFGVCVLAAIGAAVAGLSARADLEAANRSASDGLSLLAGGDLVAAAEVFATAAEQFGSAQDALERPWAAPAELVPVVSQHVRAAQGLAASASDASSTIASEVGFIDFDSLRVVNGRVDVDAVEVLSTPVNALRQTLLDLAAAVDNASNPWLISPVADRLGELAVELADQQDDIDSAAAAVASAPAMLGSEGPRVYFVAFTTPAEARGAGGFMGNWAELTIDDGKISVTDFGRTADLREGVTDKTLTSQSDEVERLYGRFLWSNLSTGAVGPSVWSNITVSPHFPTVASMIAELYPQSGGQALDGVFMLDVYAIAQLMQITGPAQLPDGTSIDHTNAVDYLLRQQYLVEDTAERVDALETVAQQAITRLLSTTLPSPRQLGDLFGQVAREGRLAGWAVREPEQDVLRRVAMTAELPAVNGGDGVAIAFNNGSANKIEVFLDAAVTYDVKVNRERQRVDATATLTLRNDAPSSGLPEYVIGNQVGAPVGTSRLQVMLYSALPVIGFRIDGEPAGFTSGTEQGYVVTSTFIDIAPGATVQMALDVGGSIDPAAEYRLVTRMPPAVGPVPFTVSVDANNTDPAPVVE